MKYIPTPALTTAAARLSGWIARLDPEDERRMHRAAPQAARKLSDITTELVRRNNRGARP